jgi:pyruvate/2-oxoglutarate dehydrogenase complex dihydrolipoamide dehydrogenase (E3) component/uncharacterized membrane protein YdjX (TVP38/TMEM64 family)
METTMTQGTASAAVPAAQGARPGRLVGLLVLLVARLAAGWLLRDRIGTFLDWVRGAGTTGMVAFVAAYVAACILFLPGLILTMGAGLVYGVAVGAPLAWVSATIGAVAAFLLGRTVARDAIAKRVASNPRFAAIDRAVEREGLKIVLLTRLSPIFPFNLLNYAYGLTGVTLRDSAIGSVGMIPGTVLYVYLGSLASSVGELAAGRADAGSAGLALQVVGFLATGAVTVLVTRLARRALNEATAENAADGAGHTGALPAHVPGRMLPDDEHNRRLLAHVHPPRRVNPTPAGRYNLVVVGAGTAGLVSAAGGAGLGAKVALIERHLMGGDCLNVGCVPSKGLIGAARVAASARAAGEFGVRVRGVDVDFPAVMERMRRLRADIAPLDGVGRFTELGVDVYLGQARFTSPTTIEVDGRTLEFSRAVVATGARAAELPIPGLADAGYLTNETIFTLTALPRRLAVVGAGPIGCEMAQSFARFGADVTLFNDVDHVLPREDADAAAIVQRQLEADGVTVRCGATITRVERRGDEAIVHYEQGGAAHTCTADRILLGVGRAPNVEDLDLEAAGIAYDRHGVTVDDRLRTTNKRVYAAGDVASRFKFTHTADALARIVLANALFRGRRKASALTVPWCTFTSPEIAHVGLYEHEARARGLEVDTITVPLRDVDRARLDGEDEGFLKVHVQKGKDTILGATLVAAHAGDMISEISVAMAAGAGLGTIANVIHPYPTQAEALKKAADAWNRTRLTPFVKKAMAWWLARAR